MFFSSLELDCLMVMFSEALGVQISKIRFILKCRFFVIRSFSIHIQWSTEFEAMSQKSLLTFPRHGVAVKMET